MFNATEKEAFALLGLIKKAGLLAPETLAEAQSVVREHLAPAGLWQKERWSLAGKPRSTELDAGMPLVKPLRRHPTFLALVDGPVKSAASALVEEQPLLPLTPHPALLFTLPNAEAWTVPHQNWHLDLPRLGDDSIPGVQPFVLLEDSRPGGGGTLTVTGSHRLLNSEGKLRSRQLRKRLLEEPFFQELMSRGAEARSELPGGSAGSVELQVTEMTGSAGDVYFMDLRLLHTLAPNALDTPRVMLTQRFLLESSKNALES